MLSLLNNMDMAEKNQDLLIAGILYNMVEDTSVSLDMIWEEFGGKVDRLSITNLEYIKERYNSDLTRLVKGEITVDLFRKEGPAMTADGLERLVEG